MTPTIRCIIALIFVMMTAGCSPSPEPQQPAAPRVTLELLSNKGDTAEAVDQIIAAFEERHPLVKIEQDAPPNMLKVLSMRFSTDTAPDLFTVYPSAPSIRQPIKEGYLEDLTGDPLLQRVKPEFIEFSQTQGRNYAIPYALEGYGIIYNTAIFRDLNLSVPQTYAQLIQTAETLKSAGITPFLFPDQDYAYLRKVSAVLLGLDDPDIIPYFEDVIAGKRHITDSPQLLRLAQKTLQLRQYGQRDSLGTSNETAVHDFADGKAAMFFTGMWEVSTIKRLNPGIDVAMFPFPADNPDDTRVAMQVGTAFGIPRNSRTAVQAKQFLEFMTTREMAQLFADETGNISIIQGVEHRVKENKGIADYALAGKLFRAADSPWTPSMQDDFGKAVQGLIAGNDTKTLMQKSEDIFYNADK
ncbi:ABC transporter substrate-binding protein [Paenibacillus doosanensis]|uniref:Probable sugar-binding periplasmic protein n=1 Tax=Paenibacillus konkukensis TaxID=2020716 RepID=A0ABY4RFZ1_9BACL|nr:MULTISPECIES: ABC transporter substrate-binding protein [Paenibacillus]MCS7463991.1 ABC transporter substrate-binding protein [Paenibacillus doosanensis]UQZ81414.1 Multiple sugar-binding protein precursor [Paenibacillus konkukensis]